MYSVKGYGKTNWYKDPSSKDESEAEFIIWILHFNLQGKFHGGARIAHINFRNINVNHTNLTGLGFEYGTWNPLVSLQLFQFSTKQVSHFIFTILTLQSVS